MTRKVGKYFRDITKYYHDYFVMILGWG